MRNFLKNHYGFYLGFLSGIGYFLFGLVISHHVNFGLFPVSLGLLAVPSILYNFLEKKLKKDTDNSLNSSKSNEAKAE